LENPSFSVTLSRWSSVPVLVPFLIMW
jgi:hypothetical protein